MHIKFNDDAIAVLVIAFIIFLPFYIFWKLNIVAYESIFPVGSWILFGASVIGTSMGLKGRIFYFIPTWIFTLSLALYTSWHFRSDVIWFLKSVAWVFIILLIVLPGFLFIRERLIIPRIEKRAIKIPGKEKGMAVYWMQVKNQFFFPTFSHYTYSICDYNLRVIDTLLAHEVPLAFAGELRRELTEARRILAGGSKARPSYEIIKEFNDTLDRTIQQWN